jgi:hypothetical protein
MVGFEEDDKDGNLSKYTKLFTGKRLEKLEDYRARNKEAKYRIAEHPNANDPIKKWKLIETKIGQQRYNREFTFQVI